MSGNLAAFRALRAQQAANGRSLSLDISVGGWTKSTHFSGCAATAEGRASMVRSGVDLLQREDFDGVDQGPHMVHSRTVRLALGALLIWCTVCGTGIDLDWEYPVCCGLSTNEYQPDDWANYLLLLREYRAELDARFPLAHKELSIAMGMGPQVTGRPHTRCTPSPYTFPSVHC